MKKRLLPIPLILLIPVVLLIIVAVAGIYRFSLSDEEILAKFPSQQPQTNVIMQSVFNIKTVNPWTVKVPDSSAFTFIDHMENPPIATGSYEDGAERGTVSVNTTQMVKLDDTTYAVVLSVSNQGSGVFYYLAVSKYDQFRQRMVVKQSALLGDRVKVTELTAVDKMITIKPLEREAGQSMAEEPSQITTILFKLTEQDSLELR
ncbi:hypothetical protein L1D24_04470 [Vibrio brasiliensis]|nr:hypothetical protein [Vibrio brasiliensis]MCG9647822.1 hypothetical protein [Vibrio brasiliensis]